MITLKIMNKKTFIWVGAIIVVAILLGWNHIFPNASPVPLTINSNTLPGIQKTTAPWQPEISHLRVRLSDIGLQALSGGESTLHIHEHIDIIINGHSVTVPANIGINQIREFMSPIHTHDNSGIIHVESPIIRNFTLGEFFDVWGVRFTKDCIGSYCDTASSTLTIYNNGKKVIDPRTLILKEHQEIAVVFGVSSSTLKIPSVYKFPRGY